MDADSWPIILLYVICLILCVYFAAAETAYTAMNKMRIRALAEEGSRKAKRALWITDRYEKSLSTMLIGTNVLHASCATLTTLFVERKFDTSYVWVGTLVTTVIIYLLGEMLPKSFGKARSESCALSFSGSLVFLVKVLTPVSFLFTAISNGISKLFKAEKQDNTVTEEDLMNIIETIEDEGVLEPEKQALVHSAVEFSSKVAADIMVSIDDVVMLNVKTPIDEIAQFVKSHRFSRIPVYENDKQNIIGVLQVNSFLNKYITKQKIDLKKMLLKTYVFDANSEISDLLSRMRLNKLHMVFLRNDKRSKIGMVTLEDILEELVGDIRDETDLGEGLELK
ncbi:MAG: HlyC/CorC family transporter [Clostridia bacterium]|nr:HlyC/CorC family transporter [Clostridia bacterium]